MSDSVDQGVFLQAVWIDDRHVGWRRRDGASVDVFVETQTETGGVPWGVFVETQRIAGRMVETGQTR